MVPLLLWAVGRPMAPDRPTDPKPTKQSDAVLLSLWRAGDRSAGTALIHRHEPAIVRFFHRRFGGEVCDLLQRTWVAILESRGRIANDHRFGAFCLGVARNIAFEEIRARVRRVPCAAELGIPEESPSPCDLALHEETIQRLARASSRLSGDFAAVVHRYYFEERTAPAIGRLLGIPENTVRSRLRRARDFLRGELAR